MYYSFTFDGPRQPTLFLAGLLLLISTLGDLHAQTQATGVISPVVQLSGSGTSDWKEFYHPRATIDITETKFRVSLQHKVLYLEDIAANMTAAQAMSALESGQFQEHTKGSLQFGYTQSVYWVYVALSNHTGQKLPIIFEVHYAPLDQITLYEIQPTQPTLIDITGDHRPYSDWPLQTRHHLLQHLLAADSIHHYLLRFETKSSYSLPLFVSTHEGFIEADHYSQWFLGLFYGIALGLLCYNLFLYITVKDSIYLKYITYVALHALFMASLDGLLYPLWPDAILWESKSIYLFAWSTAISLIMFCRSFLHTREESPTADRIMQLIQYLFIVLVVSLAALPIDLAARINSPIVLLGVICSLATTIVRYIQGYQPARFFIFGMGAFLLGAGSIALGALNLFSEYDIAPVLLKLGASIELIFFSIGLGYRINTLKAEQMSMQREAEIARAEAESRAQYVEKMKQANHQLELAMKARSDFLANMSHEIRTPMNGVMGMIELVKETPLTEEQRNYIDVAYRSGATLLTLINDILDLSKIESGKLELESIEFNLRQLLEDLKSLFSVQLADKNLFFNIHYDPTVPVWVKGDRTRVWQIITNLVGNAIKFTTEGGITVSIYRADSNSVKINVTDTGVGISKEAQQKIFESFTQADSSTTRQFGGTGLGLTISRKLAELMGGHIELTSEPGKGSTFSVIIQLEPGQPPSQGNSTCNSNGISVKSCSGMKVLLAEDNIVNQQVARGMFRKLDIELDIANDGSEATIKASRKPYDLIFMDVQMPNLDGLEATRFIRDHQGPNRTTPVIAMTANAMQGDKDACLLAGMNDYITKPVQKDKLVEVIIHWKNQRFSAEEA